MEMSSVRSLYHGDVTCELLTCFCDVEWQPEEEGVANQLSEQQTQRELYHPLQAGTHITPENTHTAVKKYLPPTDF